MPTIATGSTISARSRISWVDRFRFLPARIRFADLKTRFAYAFKGTPLYPPVIEPFVIDDEMPFGDAILRFTDQPHGGITSLGIRIDRGSSVRGLCD